jgi:hypothetical protein
MITSSYIRLGILSDEPLSYLQCSFGICDDAKVLGKAVLRRKRFRETLWTAKTVAAVPSVSSANGEHEEQKENLPIPQVGIGRQGF